MPGSGHNSRAAVGGIAGDRLLGLIERIERLEHEKKALSSDIRDIYLEAKGAGFDVKTVRRLVRDRQADKADLEEQETLYDLYSRAIGL